MPSETQEQFQTSNTFFNPTIFNKKHLFKRRFAEGCFITTYLKTTNKCDICS